MEAADLVKKALSMAHQSVLATIVYVDGHAYRKAGASMLLEAGGGTNGSVSPGCLEADLTYYVEPALREGGCQWVEYDMRSADDLAWGEAIGCGGLIRILLEPVTGDLLPALSAVHQLLESGENAVLTRSFGASMLPISYDVLAANDAAARIDLPSEDRMIFHQRWEAKPRVILFGGGDDALPVARLVRMAGFRLTVADFREAVLTPERFPGAELRHGFPEQLMEELNISKRDYILVMSHQFRRDYEFLKLALEREPHYIGVMGSSSRTKRMFPEGYTPPSVHYPVGLSIGADGPEEIAISIAAELVGVRRKGNAAAKTKNRGVIFGSRLKPANGQAEAAR